jgi:hypothetical protein
MKIKKLDFSQFHPLDHNIFDKECKEWYGGRLNHIKLWWRYQFEPDLVRNTLCRLGLHRFVEYNDNKDKKWLACYYCCKEPYE